MWPLPSNIDQQDYCMFSRGFQPKPWHWNTSRGPHSTDMSTPWIAVPNMAGTWTFPRCVAWMPSLTLTASLHLNMDGWKMIVSFWVFGPVSVAFAGSFGDGHFLEIVQPAVISWEDSESQDDFNNFRTQGKCVLECQMEFLSNYVFLGMVRSCW